MGRVISPPSFNMNILKVNSNIHGASMGISTFQNPALDAYFDKAHHVKTAKAML